LGLGLGRTEQAKQRYDASKQMRYAAASGTQALQNASENPCAPHAASMKENSAGEHIYSVELPNAAAAKLTFT
jgi:hypothetical protein